MNGIIFVLVLLGSGLLLFGGLQGWWSARPEEPLSEPEPDWDWRLDPELNWERISQRR